MDIDHSLLETFLIEAQEHLDVIERGLLSLESLGDQRSPDLVNGIFRSMHTIKGSAGSIGFEAVSKLAHVMENILSRMREGEVHPKPEIVSAMLEGLDALKRMINDVDRSSEVETERIVTALNACMVPRKVAPESEAGWEIFEDEPESPAPLQAMPSSEVAPEISVAPVSVADRQPPPQSKTVEAAPSAQETVRLRVSLLDQLMALTGELVLVRNQLLLSVDKDDPTARTIAQRLNVVTGELQEKIMRTRMQTFGNIQGKVTRIVRDLAFRLKKQVRLDFVGKDVEVDKTILENLTDPLLHLVRNSCDHGIETPEDREDVGKAAEGVIAIRAYHEAGQIHIEIKDNGKGMDPVALKASALSKGVKTEAELAKMSDREALGLIFLPGFSTAKTVSDVSGRGVGMDVVKSAIDQLGGSIEIQSVVGQGTTILMRLPLTLAIIPCIIVTVGKERYAIPQVNLEELVCLYDDEVREKIETAANSEVYRLRSRLLPMVRLSEALQRDRPFDVETKGEITALHRHQQAERVRLQKRALAADPETPPDRQSLNFLVLRWGSCRFGLIVDSVVRMEDIVVTPMHSALKGLGIYSGATIMGDGYVALILDVQGLANHAAVDMSGGPESLDDHHHLGQEAPKTPLLLFKSGKDELYALPLQEIRRIEEVRASQLEKIGSSTYVTLDGHSTMVACFQDYLPVSPVELQGSFYLILPKAAPAAIGFVASKLVDVGNYHVALDAPPRNALCLKGTALVRDKMAIFPDIAKIVERAIDIQSSEGGLL